MRAHIIYCWTIVSHSMTCWSKVRAHKIQAWAARVRVEVPIKQLLHLHVDSWAGCASWPNTGSFASCSSRSRDWSHYIASFPMSHVPINRIAVDGTLISACSCWTCSSQARQEDAPGPQLSKYSQWLWLPCDRALGLYDSRTRQPRRNSWRWHDVINFWKCYVFEAS